MILVSSPLRESELPRQLSRDVRTISNICDGNIRRIILAAKSLQPCTKTAETADLVAFTEEILNGKLCLSFTSLFSWEVSENLRTHIFKENFGIVAASKLYF